MSKEFWNSRYSEKEYVYGKEPNEYFKEELDKLPVGSILLPGEGEGRNAIYAAKKGWKVTAVDFSSEARKKALQLSEENNVSIDYKIGNIEDSDFAGKKFDVIALIFVHFSETIREKIHKSIINLLNESGVIIIEAYSKAQINNNSGGPKDLSSLYSIEDFRNDFSRLGIEYLKEQHIKLKEGSFHEGEADVIRFRGKLTN